MTALRAIHAGVRHLGLDDDLKRALYAQVTGKDSAADMTETERQAVVKELRKRGFKPVSKGRKTLTGPYAKKLQALWIAAWNLGLVRNRDDKALLAFVKRQTGLDHTRFLHHADDAAKAIEALKGWLARDAGVDWSVGDHLPHWARTPGYKIARAQFAFLKDRSPDFARFTSLRHWLMENRLEGADWIIVTNALGKCVRAVR